MRKPQLPPARSQAPPRSQGLPFGEEKGRVPQASKKATPPRDWEELKLFLPELPPEERRAAEALAQGRALGQEEERLARRALFKLRMRKGRARKEVAPA